MPSPDLDATLDDTAEVVLRRSVRFCVNFDANEHDDRGPAADARPNTFSAAPAMTGLGAYYEIVIACRGRPDPLTGYLVNISAIDRVVRGQALPLIERACVRGSSRSPQAILGDLLNAVRRELGTIAESITWRLTPYYSLHMNAHAAERVSIRQSFEFSAAHRLHVESLDDAKNREIFGKCNNPSGHGHNYRVDVTVAVTLGDPARFTLRDLERIVAQHVIDRFDHKHLNRDTVEFARINPSVENIARVCHGLLREPIAQAGGDLRQVRIWETEKTSCTYPA